MGGVVGGVAVLALLCGVLLVYLRRRRQAAAKHHVDMANMAIGTAGDWAAVGTSGAEAPAIQASRQPQPGGGKRADVRTDLPALPSSREGGRQ